MPTIWDAAVRAGLTRRMASLTPAATPRWGHFHVAGMVAHLNDSLRMATGELQAAPKRLPLRFFPLKQFVVYWAPFPKGAPTAPELLVRCADAELDVEQAAFATLLERAGTASSTADWPPHPAFGTLSRQAWGVLIYRHTDHHLRQFGA